MAAGSPFNPRQQQMIEMMSRGASQVEMATFLGIPYQRLRRRLMDIRVEVGALTNEHLIAICYQQGWLPASRRSSNPSSPGRTE